jgi:hypothetical protein
MVLIFPPHILSSIVDRTKKESSGSFEEKIWATRHRAVESPDWFKTCPYLCIPQSFCSWDKGEDVLDGEAKSAATSALQRSSTCSATQPKPSKAG